MIKEMPYSRLTPFIDMDAHKLTKIKYNWVSVDIYIKSYELWAYQRQPIIVSEPGNDVVWDVRFGDSDDYKLPVADELATLSLTNLAVLFELTEQEQVYEKLKGNALRICVPIIYD